MKQEFNLPRSQPSPTHAEGGKSSIVPNLRFPEFRGAEGWAPKPMGEVYSFKSNNSLPRDKLNYLAGSGKNIHYGDIHTKFSTHFDIARESVPFINPSEEGQVREHSRCAEGDMVFADASEDLADIGKSIEIVALNGVIVVAGLHTILARPIGDQIVLGFGGHLFQSGCIRTQIQREAQGAKVLGISANRMRNLRLPVPRAQAEQQKIADCLSSLDELMAAQARKVDAIKAHKKGLMQKLFPQEGETQPRLRFPEFQDAGEWEWKRLAELVDIQSGATPSKANSAFWNGTIPWVSAKDMKQLCLEDSEDHVSVKAIGAGARLVPPGTLLILTRGMTLLKDVPICVLRREMSFNQDVKGLLPRVGNNGLFLAWMLTSSKPRLLAVVDVAGHGTGKIDTTDLKAFALALPSTAEQHRIATCLSNLDALITAETRKLEALKTHKRGLMQQLFPSMESAA